MGQKIPHVDTTNPDKYWASARVPWYVGRVVGVDLPTVKSDIHFEWNCKIGDVFTRNVVTTRDYAGEVYLSNTDYQQLAADFASLRGHHFIQVEPVVGDSA